MRRARTGHGPLGPGDPRDPARPKETRGGPRPDRDAGRRGWLAPLALLLAAVPLGAAPPPGRAAAQAGRVDLALVLAVDVSASVDAARFELQMRGIAGALEDPRVQTAMFSGPHGAVLVSLVQWANRPTLSVPWTVLARPQDARRLAADIRRTPRVENGFTCMSVALRSIADKLLLQLPVPAERVVVDVSGDGRDNCNRAPVDGVRDELAAAGVTVNGLPILEGDEAGTLEAWYRDHVIGGPGAFLVPAYGYADVGRALRHKFATEIGLGPPAPAHVHPLPAPRAAGG